MDFNRPWGIVAFIVSFAFPLKLWIDFPAMADHPVLLLGTFIYVRIVIGMIETLVRKSKEQDES